MITGKGLRERYEQWETRRRARMAGWSVRRRWTVLILIPLTVLCCCGGVVVVPVIWLVRTTVDAGRGEASPTAAANSYLLALGYAQEQGLPALLDDSHEAELEQQWHAYRATMTAAVAGSPDTLDIGDLTSGPVTDGRATVTADVAATWWDHGGTTRAMRSTGKTWTIETHEDNGWRVSRVTAPPWCGPGGYVVTCANTLPGEVPASSSPSPSDDPMAGPREMLPCGPHDPFPEWHSCPPSTRHS